jgi:putative nucleotidyltransferase with HDIG domain
MPLGVHLAWALRTQLPRLSFDGWSADGKTVTPNAITGTLIRYRGLALLLVLPVLALTTFKSRPEIDPLLSSASVHLVVVSAIAAASTVVAVMAARAARRTMNAGPVLLAMGCLAVGILMTGHGLVTPGVGGQPFNPWVIRLSWLALLAFAIVTLLASRPPTRLHRWVAAHPTTVLVVTFVAVLLPVGYIVMDPLAIAPSFFSWENDARWAATVVIAAACLVSSVTHWRRWRLGADPVQFSLSAASAMVVAAVTSLRLGELWRLSWYDYHGYLLAGFAGAVVAIVISERRSREVLDTLSTAFEADPIVHITTGYPEALRTLVRAVEVKDPYTHGHSRRTAELAARLGGRLRLSTDDLRALTRGAYLHDIGKIGIPEQILNKPGRLDVEERIEIERHPLIGVEMVRGATSLAETADVILHHHERWDGMGYPSGLAGVDIPFLARITTVADVWDALTTNRPYRSGWSGSEALAHIVAGSGSHFDPSIVGILVEVAYTDLGVRRPTGVGDVAEAIQAAERCHELEPSPG